MAKYSGLFGRIREAVPSSELDLVMVLDYVYVRHQNGQVTRTTDLVQKLEFGTGPTVHRKTLALVESGRLKLAALKGDSRAKALVVTAAGEKWLAMVESKTV